MVTHSSRGAAISRGMANLTIDYLEGRQPKTMTLNLTPQMILRLRDACEEMISPETTPRDEA